MIPEFKPGTFPDPLRVENVLGDRAFRLLERFRYIASDGRRVEVPPDALWNGASIPRFFWRVMGCPFIGKHRKPSVIHDWLWAQAKHGCGTYAYANWMFYDALRSRSMWTFKAWLMWLAVAFNAQLQI